MRPVVAALVAIVIVFQPCIAIAEGVAGSPDSDTRLYLSDGTVLMGNLVEESDEVIIIRDGQKIFTFEPRQVVKKETLYTPGVATRTVTVREFPYISFLGAAAAFGLLSWLQFDTATSRDEDARRHEQQGAIGEGGLNLSARAQDLRDKADRARLWGWSSALLAAGSLGIAVMPTKKERRIFHQLTMQTDHDAQLVMLFYTRQF